MQPLTFSTCGHTPVTHVCTTCMQFASCSSPACAGLREPHTLGSCGLLFTARREDTEDWESEREGSIPPTARHRQRPEFMAAAEGEEEGESDESKIHRGVDAYMSDFFGKKSLDEQMKMYDGLKEIQAHDQGVTLSEDLRVPLGVLDRTLSKMKIILLPEMQRIHHPDARSSSKSRSESRSADLGSKSKQPHAERRTPGASRTPSPAAEEVIAFRADPDQEERWRASMEGGQPRDSPSEASLEHTQDPNAPSMYDLMPDPDGAEIYYKSFDLDELLGMLQKRYGHKADSELSNEQRADKQAMEAALEHLKSADVEDINLLRKKFVGNLPVTLEQSEASLNILKRAEGFTTNRTRQRRFRILIDEREKDLALKRAELRLVSDAARKRRAELRLVSDAARKTYSRMDLQALLDTRAKKYASTATLTDAEFTDKNVLDEIIRTVEEENDIRRMFSQYNTNELIALYLSTYEYRQASSDREYLEERILKDLLSSQGVDVEALDRS